MKKILKFMPLLITAVTFVTVFYCCDDKQVEKPYGNIVLKFDHFYNGDTLQLDKMIYTNAAGNQMEFTEVQWFISDIVLHNSNGKTQSIKAWEWVHYVDVDIPSTLSWAIKDKIDTGTYTSISFVFGITGAKNKPYMFVNFPESAMMWPYYLGGDSGGYHYMMLNGFWKDSTNFRRGFNFHLGVGQQQDSAGVRIKDKNGNFIFVQNWFTVNLPASSFTLKKDGKKEISIVMNIDEWFKNPNVWDLNYWGPDIMENQRAMKAAVENGVDVFTTGSIRDL